MIELPPTSSLSSLSPRSSTDLFGRDCPRAADQPGFAFGVHKGEHHAARRIRAGRSVGVRKETVVEGRAFFECGVHADVAGDSLRIGDATRTNSFHFFWGFEDFDEGAGFGVHDQGGAPPRFDPIEFRGSGAYPNRVGDRCQAEFTAWGCYLLPPDASQSLAAWQRFGAEGAVFASEPGVTLVPLFPLGAGQALRALRALRARCAGLAGELLGDLFDFLLLLGGEGALSGKGRAGHRQHEGDDRDNRAGGAEALVQRT